MRNLELSLVLKMNNFITITLCCAIFGLTYGVPVNQTVIFKMGSSDASSGWLDGANGLYCGRPENINSHHAGCQGTKSFSDKLLHEEHKSGAMPGAQFGRLSPYNKILTYSGNTELKYIKVEYTFGLGVGTSRLLSGGVGTKSATVQISSPRCGAYGYKIQYYG